LTNQDLVKLAVEQDRRTDFDVTTGDFSSLTIRNADGYFYFYDSANGRLVKRFRLRDGSQVDTLCNVILTKTGDLYSPRLRFWKRNKTSSATAGTEAGAPLAKASVDVSDSHQEFWKLMQFLRSVRELDLPLHGFQLTESSNLELLSTLEQYGKAEILQTVKVHLEGDLDQRDIEILVDRRSALRRFERLLEDPAFFKDQMAVEDRKPEAVWQQFFEDNPWIFGYGLNLVACESFSPSGLQAFTTGANVFTGGGKRIDAAMRTKGFVHSLMFVEIKRHDTPLLAKNPYRPPDVYMVSAEVSGAVAQVQKTTHKATKVLHDLHREHTADGTYGFDVLTIRPRQVVVVGHLRDLSDDGVVNLEKATAFEHFRRNQVDVEVLTYDELLERTRFILADG
jgi:hypothetical protein